MARAVAVGVIDPDEANLIAVTRLDNRTLAQAAEAAGIPASTAGSWRSDAERRLVEAIADGELAFVPLRARWRRASGPPVGRVFAHAGTNSTAVGRALATGTTNNGGVGRVLAANTINSTAVGQLLAADTFNSAIVGQLLAANTSAAELLATQQKALEGKASDREAAGVGAPGPGARPA